MAFLRAFNYKQAPLPDVFDFWVRTIPEEPREEWLGAIGYLPKYGVKASMLNEADVQLGDRWEVKLEAIDVFPGEVYVKPVRLLHREQL